MPEHNYKNDYSIHATNARSLNEVECFTVAKNFAAFGFEADFLLDKRELDRIDIAKSYAITSPGNLITYIKQFAISDPDARRDIAKIAMEGHPYLLGKKLGDFDIIKYEDRLELAIGIARKLGGKTILELLPNIGIDPDKHLVDLAKSAAQNAKVSFSRDLEEWGVFDEQTLIEIASIEAISNPTDFCVGFNNYGLRSRQIRFKFAKQIAQIPGVPIIGCIGNFDLSEEERLEIARIALSSNPEHLLSYFKSLKLSDESDRLFFAQSLIGIIEDHYGIAASIDNFELTTETNRLELFEEMVKKTPAVVAKHFESFKISDEITRIKCALSVAKMPGSQISSHISNFHISDNKSLFEIGVTAGKANDPNLWASSLANFAITDQVVIEKFAKEIAPYYQYFAGFKDLITRLPVVLLNDMAIDNAAVTSNDITTFVKQFKITEPSLLQRIGLILASRSDYHFSSTIGHYLSLLSCETPELHESIPLSLVQNCPNFLPDMIESFNALKADIRFKLASICAQDYPLETARNLNAFGLLPSEEDSIFSLCIKKDPQCLQYVDKTTLTMKGCVVKLLEYITSKTDFDMVDAVNTLILCRLMQIEPSVTELPLHRRDLKSEGPIERYTRITQWICDNVPGIDNSLKSFSSEVSSEYGMEGAIIFSLLAWNQIPSNCPNRCRASLAKVCGFHTLPMDLKFSSRTISQLYELSLNLFWNARGPFGEKYGITETYWNDPNKVIEMMLCLTSLQSLGAEDEVDTILAIEDLNERLKLGDQILFEKFCNLLGLEESSIAGANITTLIEKWGDLSPIIILISRFNGMPEWRNEVDVLREIIIDVLQDNFHSKKYNRPQLKGLRDLQIDAWKTNPCSLDLIYSTPPHPGDENFVITNLKHIFERNVLLNLPFENAEAIRTSKEFTNLEDVRDDNAFNLRYPDLNSALIQLQFMLANEVSIEQFRKFLTLLNNNKLRILRNLPELTATQIGRDITDMKETVSVRKSTSSKGYIIFTTISDDPKLLLTVGDLVQSGSCQNYKTGDKIDALPGYAIDANIKILVSYVLSESHVRHLLNIPTWDSTYLNNLSYVFDAPLQQLTITDNKTTRSYTFPLGYAMHRRVLRVGFDANNQGVLFAEKAYVQNHAVQVEIHQKADQLIHNFRERCQLQQAKGIINFHRSSNPGGVYSDQAQGIQTEGYRLMI